MRSSSRFGTVINSPEKLRPIKVLQNSMEVFNIFTIATIKPNFFRLTRDFIHNSMLNVDNSVVYPKYFTLALTSFILIFCVIRL